MPKASQKCSRILSTVGLHELSIENHGQKFNTVEDTKLNTKLGENDIG